MTELVLFNWKNQLVYIVGLRQVQLLPDFPLTFTLAFSVFTCRTMVFSTVGSFSYTGRIDLQNNGALQFEVYTYEGKDLDGYSSCLTRH